MWKSVMWFLVAIYIVLVVKEALDMRAAYPTLKNECVCCEEVDHRR
jgi:hypothetical protein